MKNILKPLCFVALFVAFSICTLACAIVFDAKKVVANNMATASITSELSISPTSGVATATTTNNLNNLGLSEAEQNVLILNGITSETGNSAAFTVSDSFISTLSISLTTGTDIVVKRLVGNNLIKLTEDDSNSPINDASLPAKFSYGGIYVVTYKINTTSYYQVFKFNQTLDLTKAPTIANATLYRTTNKNIYIPNTANDNITEGSFPSMLEASLDLDLFDTSTSASWTYSNGISMGNSISFFRKDDSFVTSFEFTVIEACPYVSFISNGATIDDLVTSYNLTNETDPDINCNTKFFNQQVAPSLSLAFTEYEQYFAYSNTSDGNFNIIKVYVCGVEMEALQTKYRVVTKYTDYFNIFQYIGDENRSIEMKLPNDSIYNYTKIKSFYGLNLNKNINYTISGSYENANSVEMRTGTSYVFIQNSGEYIAGFKMNVSSLTGTFDESNSYYYCTDSANSLAINYINSETYIPVDVYVQRINNTGDPIGSAFVIENVLNYSYTTDINALNYIEIVVNDTGRFVWRIKPHNIYLADASCFMSDPFYAGNGKIISVNSGNTSLVDNQIINGAVTVSCKNALNATQEFSVSLNGVSQGIFTTDSTFSTPGLYVVKCDTSIFSFSIVPSVATQYSVSNFDKVSVLSYSNGITTTDIDENGYINLIETGKYTINCKYNNALSYTIGAEGKSLDNSIYASFEVNIAKTAFGIYSNTTHGTKTSDKIIISSITANGNWKVDITFGKKTTSYTKDEFTALSEKDRTFSKNGIYKIVVTDENGNTYAVQYQKYFSINAAGLALIIIACIMVAAAIVLLIKVRGKSKVK